MHCEAVAGFIKQLKGSSATAQVLAAQKLHIEGMLAQADLSVAQAGRIMSSLGEIPWDDVVLAELTQMIAQRTLCAPSLPQLGRSRLQDYRSLVHYFSEAEWAQLSSERVLSHSKLELLLGRSISLALRNPTEATLQAIASLYLACAEGYQKAVNLNAQLKYNTLQHIKKVFKSMHKPPLAHAILVLPASPSELAKSFPALWSEVFGKQPPTDARVSTIELEALGQTIPMRSTSRLMISGSAPVAQPDQPQVMALVSALHKMLGVREVAGSIPIQVFPRRAKALPALVPTLVLGAGASSPARSEAAEAGDKGEEKKEEEQQEGEDEEEEEEEKEQREEEDADEEDKKAAEKPMRAVAKRGGEAKAKNSKGTDGKEMGGLPIMKRPAGVAERAQKKAKVCVEDTRSQVRCRSADGTSFAIPWGSRGGRPVGTREDALRKARSWLAKQA